MRVEGRAIRKQFGRVEALRGLDFSIPSGGKVGLIGPNASGKSTLIRIILGLLRCDGELLLDGENKRRIEDLLGLEMAAVGYPPDHTPSALKRLGRQVRAMLVMLWLRGGIDWHLVPGPLMVLRQQRENLLLFQIQQRVHYSVPMFCCQTQGQKWQSRW